MFFNKDLTKLLFVPAGMEATAILPNTTEAVPVGAFSHSARLTSVRVGESCASYSAENGILYSKDKTTLVAAPAGIGTSVVIPKETKVIGAEAFMGTVLESIVVPGAIGSIDPSSFSKEVCAQATVVLSTKEDYESRKTIWENAGFINFQEPAKPGDTTAPNQDGDKEAGFIYTLLPDYTLSVAWMGDLVPSGALVIPTSATLNNASYRVSAVAPYAFEGASITSLTVPSAVSTVGEYAFAGCTSLETVTLEEGVTTLGDSAFASTAITQVMLPRSITSVARCAFANINALTSVVSLSDIEQIAEDALAGCSGVSILTPQRLTEEYSWNLGLVSSRNHIEPYGIASTSKNMELSLGESKDLFDPLSVSAPKDCFISYTYAANKISVSAAGVVEAKQAGETDVVANLMLNDVVLAQVIRTVVVESSSDDLKEPKDPQASSLPSVTPLSGMSLSLLDGGISLLAVGGTFIEGDYKYTILEDGTTEAARRVSIAPADKSISINDPVLPSSVDFAGKVYKVTAIASRAFGHCFSLAGTVTIPESIVSIASGPFVYSDKLIGIKVATSNGFYSSQDGILYSKDMKELIQCPAGKSGSFTIPESVAKLAADSFMGCKIGLSAIPDSVTSIGSAAFESCLSIQGSIVLSNKVTSLGHGVFAYCFNLNIINVASDNPNYISQDGVVYAKDMLEIIQYPPGRSGGFSVPDSVITIDNAFRGCAKLSSVIIPESVKVLRSYTFSGCNSLASVVLLGGPAALEGSTFKGCSSLLDIYVDYDVTSMHQNVFDLITPSDIQVHLAPGISDTAWRNAGCKVSQSPFVVFDATGGNPAPKPQDVTSGQPTTKPETDPVKDGYVFAGWYTAPTGGTAWNFSTPVTEVATLYAQWKVAHTVTFDGNGGTPEVSTKTVADGASLGAGGIPSTPIRTGYDFQGWFTAATGGTKYDFNSAVNADVTLYAHWALSTYNITYEPNGGSSVAAHTATYDSKLTQPTCTRTGYALEGWYTEAALRNKWDFASNSVAGDTKLYAKWTANTYTIAFDANDGNGTMANQTGVVFGVATPLNANTYTREGHTFAGWAISPTGDVEFTDQASVTSLVASGEAKLYAKWSPVEYNVIFDLDGGSGVTTPIKAPYGSTVTKPSANPTKNGYTFDAWYKDAGKTTLWDFAVDTVGMSTTIYAKYTANSYAVHFDSNGGAGDLMDDQTFTYGADPKALSKNTYTKTGYVFAGWATTPTGAVDYTDAQAVSNLAFSGIFNLFAVWTPITYSVHFNSSEGEGAMDTQTGFTYDIPTPLSANQFIKKGHTFAGWATQEAGSIVYLDQALVSTLTPQQGQTVELWAVWTKDTYNVSFESNKGTAVPPTEVLFGELIQRPEDPTRTGYAFVGWYRNKSLNILWDFDVDTVQNETILYAKWTAVVDIDVPLDPKIAIDAQGSVSADEQAIRPFVSRTPQDVLVTSVSCISTESTIHIFPDRSQWPRIGITLAPENDPSSSIEAKLNKSNTQPSFIIPAATSVTPSEFPISFGLSLPADIQLSYSSETDGVPIAQLSYTFELVS